MSETDDQREPPAGDGEEEEQEDHEEQEDRDDGRLAELRAMADAEADSLQRGRTVSLLGASVPLRTLIAIAIFIVVFMLAWTALWALLGTIGLALGWIPAALLGVLAIRLAPRD